MPSERQPSSGWHSRGYLPHFDGGEIAQTVTLRLADSLPQTLLARWKQELQHDDEAQPEITLRRRIEAWLDQGCGSCWLRDERVAAMMQDALLHFDGARYRLSAWVVMPNHIHLLLTPGAGHGLSGILHSLKSFTAQQANQQLARKGSFWQADYFDRYVRDARHFANAVAYIENNPVKAGLCRNPEDWPYSSAWFRHSANEVA